jgi:5-methylcytosine-specific restriction enzyme subunit McrC
MLCLRMREWERLTSAENPALATFSFADDAEARALAQKLTEAEILEVVELREGLSIRSTSYVGRVQLRDLQLTIQPKIELNVLLTLFGYAYRLPDLRMMTNSKLDAEPHAFQDILIHQLIVELTKLLSRGLHRQYRKAEGSLAVTKGRIDIQRIARQTGGHGTDIPVIHHPKLEDNLINQALLAGVRLAFSLTTDVNIRSRLRRLASQMEGSISPIHLDSGVMMRLSREMNRLMTHYEPSITLIELLMSSSGITLEAKVQQAALPGFLFDMNSFFERLLSRFLKENLPAYTVHDQQRLKGMMAYNPQHNPKRRRSPTPRPDFVITDGERLVAILDAKYRDLWDQSLPHDMLYQLAMYALSQGWNGQSIILYPSVTNRPVPQVIEINEAFANSNKARVILTPVNLNDLSELLQDMSVSARTNRAAYAEHLLLGSIHISR